MVSGTSQKMICLTGSILRSGTTKVHTIHEGHGQDLVGSICMMYGRQRRPCLKRILSGATIPPVNGKTWDFLCPNGNAPAGAPCPTSLTGDISIVLCICLCLVAFSQHPSWKRVTVKTDEYSEKFETKNHIAIFSEKSSLSLYKV